MGSAKLNPSFHLNDLNVLNGLNKLNYVFDY